MRIALLVVTVLGAWWGTHWYREREAPRPADGVLVSGRPLYHDQLDRRHWSYSRLVEGLEYAPTARFELTARVLSVRAYPTDGYKLDLVLGWGLMSDNRTLDTLEIRQSNRGYEILRGPSTSITPEQAYRSSMILTLITRGARLYVEPLYRIRVNDVIRIAGITANIRDADGLVWSGGDGTRGRAASILDVSGLQINDQELLTDWFR